MGKKVQGGTGDSARLHRLSIQLIISYAVVILIAVALVATVLLTKTSRTFTSKMGELLSSTNAQMKMNVDRYQREIEETAILIFADSKFYKYDASNKEMTDYEHVEMQNEIQDRLLEISMTKNFSDFGIVYRNGKMIGRISEGTKHLYGSKLFGMLEKGITDSSREDGWCIGYEDNYERLYYVKKLNENAILAAAIYTTELSNVFTNQEGMEDMQAYLLTDDYHIIYAKKRKEIGQLISDEIAQMISQKEYATMLNKDYLLAASQSNEKWSVICVIPTEVLTAQNRQLIDFAVLIAGVIILFTIVLSIVLSKTITTPITGIVTNLNEEASVDKLTKCMRRNAFEEIVSREMSVHPLNYMGYLLVDIDNFKGINDHYGHMAGDQVLTYVGEILHSFFKENAYICRIGGDEFAVAFLQGEHQKESELLERVNVFYETYPKFQSEETGVLNITFSSGLTWGDNCNYDYKRLYREADCYLYQAKECGKNQFAAKGEKGGIQA